MLHAENDAAVSLDQGIRVDFGPADRAALDATGGALELPAASLDVVSLPLTGLTRSPADIAALVGLVPEGGFLHGARWGVLAPVDGHWRVSILTAGTSVSAESRLDVGRLSDRDVERWAKIFDGRVVRVVVFIEAAPFAGLEVRFLRSLIEAPAEPTPLRTGPSRDQLDLATPPPAPAQWYVDPADPTQQRFWDGSAWTTHVAAG